MGIDGSIAPEPLGILISGRGSNMEALIRASQQGRLNAQIRVVISNRDEAPGLTRARALGVVHQALPIRPGEVRARWEMRLVALLRDFGVTTVALAGFDRLLTPTFLACFPGRVVNIHPSLLPRYPGPRAQAQAIEDGATVSGCTVHLVDEGMDSGPILAFARVEVLSGDSEETLSERILAAEHWLYPETLQRWLRGDIVPQPQGGG